MSQRTKDFATIALTAPLVMATRSAQMASGSMSPAEFTRMWVEKPVAFAASVATLQVEAAMAFAAAMGNPFVRRKPWDVVMGTALRPYAKAVGANHRRLSRR